MRNTAPPFGKRNRPAPAVRSVPAAAAPTVDHAAFFAAARQEIEAPDERPKIVPRSFRAALLAGLVIGFCLAGLDVTKSVTVDPALAPLHLDTLLGDPREALPYMIAFSLLTGARGAAAILLVAHRLLAWAGHSGHLAYALGGAAIAAAYAGLLLGLVGQAPQHGWLIDIAAGAGAGFFYRMFAGARRV